VSRKYVKIVDEPVLATSTLAVKVVADPSGLRSVHDRGASGSAPAKPAEKRVTTAAATTAAEAAARADVLEWEDKGSLINFMCILLWSHFLKQEGRGVRVKESRASRSRR
jgi:hypothetical protein